jgi:hypothetical protein
MDTNETQQTSTPDADNCGALRTKSGQGDSPTPDKVTTIGPNESTQPGVRCHRINVSFEARSRDEVIERLCMKVFGAVPVYPDPVPDVFESIVRAAGDWQAERTDAEIMGQEERVATITEGILGSLRESGNDLRSSAFSHIVPWVREAINPIGQPVWNGIGQPGSVMPMPDTKVLDIAPSDTPAAKSFNSYWASHHGKITSKDMKRMAVEIIADLERQLAEARRDREIITQDCERWRSLSIQHARERDALSVLVEGFMQMPMGATTQALNLKRKARTALASMKEPE